MIEKWTAIKEQYDALLERSSETQAKENTSDGEVMYSPRSVGYQNILWYLLCTERGVCIQYEFVLQTVRILIW